MKRGISELIMIKINSTLNSDFFHNTTVFRKVNMPRGNSNKFFNLILFWRWRQIKQKNRAKTSKYCSQNNMISANCGNEVVLSSSGQKKIDNLASCLSLVKSDFIIF